MHALPHPATCLEESPSEPFAARRENMFLIAAFLIGALNHFAIRLVGLMPVSELIILALIGWVILFIILSGWSPVGVDAPRVLLLLLVCQVIGLAGYVMSDLVRGSATGDMLRGWSRMIFLGLDLCGVAFLLHHSRRVLAALACGLVAGVMEPVLLGPLFGDWWKFGFGVPVTILLLLVGARWLGGAGAVIGLLSAAAAHVVLDFRSMAALCVVVAGLLSLRLLPLPLRRLCVIGCAFIGLLVAPAVWQRTLNSSEQRASRSNAERSAMLQAAAEAFTSSPWVGSGSWFSNTDVMEEFLEIRKANAQLAGIGGFDETDAEGLAIHSQLLVSLAEGGIFGAAFFIAYGFLLIGAIYLVAVELPFHALIPFMLFFLFSGFFNLLMSPFSGAHRVEIAITAGIILKGFAEFTASRQNARTEDPETREAIA